MANFKLVSFDLKADFGFFKKPDINDGLYLTYNMLHKPTLLGILGAIVGLQGYQKNGEFPEYYQILKSLKIGIQPLGSNKGNFAKDILSYNNGTGFASFENGGNLIVREQFLIRPAYRCYLLLDLDSSVENDLANKLSKYHAEFLPYMGKNDFSAWWENFVEYDYNVFDFSCDYKIMSVFSKTEAASQYVVKQFSLLSKEEAIWFYFERLPICFNEQLWQYMYSDFVFSNATFAKGMDMSTAGLFYEIVNGKGERGIIQLF
jgi:CRISPR-associated protein Cas5h